MFKCFSIRERDGDFIKAQIPASSRETLVEPMPVLRPPSATTEGGRRERDGPGGVGRGDGMAGGSRFLHGEGEVRREGRILSGQG